LRVNRIDFLCWRLRVKGNFRRLSQRRKDAKEREGRSDGRIEAAREVSEGGESTNLAFTARYPPVFASAETK